MNSENDSLAPLPARSPLLLDRDHSALLVIDMQERLMPAIRRSEQVAWNARRLIRAAQLLQIPVVATEQYPRGLGPTVPAIRQLLDAGRDHALPEKQMFSCRQCAPVFDALRSDAIRQIVVVGIEAHVCVLQTTLDLIAQGFELFPVGDGIGSRFEPDWECAIRRMELSGATLVTTEMALFEWCETSATDEFKSISALVRESVPVAGDKNHGENDGHESHDPDH